MACGDLKRNVHYGLRYMNPWFFFDKTVLWGGSCFTGRIARGEFCRFTASPHFQVVLLVFCWRYIFFIFSISSALMKCFLHIDTLWICKSQPPSYIALFIVFYHSYMDKYIQFLILITFRLVTGFTILPFLCIVSCAQISHIGSICDLPLYSCTQTIHFNLIFWKQFWIFIFVIIL